MGLPAFFYRTEVTFLMNHIYSKKILVVDDDESIVHMVNIVLKKEGFTHVYKALNGTDAMNMARDITPDLVVLDIMLPDSDGYEVCRKIREFSMAPIIFLSAKTEETDKLVSFAVGGDEYLTKPFSPKELVARIQVALKRQAYYEDGSKQGKQYSFGSGFCLDLETRILKQHGETIALPPKEYALLEYLVINQDITISKEYLIQRVWGSDFGGVESTVAVHIRHLREKIEEDPANPRLIKTVKGRGYYFSSRV